MVAINLTKLMPNKVAKRDGSTQDFDEAKIRNSIHAACHEAELAEERIEELLEIMVPNILNSLASKEEVTFSEIREAIFEELEKNEPTVIEAWKNYERNVKGLEV